MLYFNNSHRNNEKQDSSTDFPIDAVITWVDGEDPKHKEKRRKYGSKEMFLADDVAGSTRYTSIGEIFYCIASLNRYAPWLHKIYIVTDAQNPHIDEFIKANFPEKHIPMEIIDHTCIFRGYEEYLPTFNSIAIETMTWRIPNLSEHYIEFNDDLILAAPTLPQDFFPERGKVNCYGKWYLSPVVHLLRLIQKHKNGSRKITFKLTMMNAATLLGNRFTFIKIYHTPKPLLKSVYKNFFSKYPECMKENISHRFRCQTQFNSQEIQYLILSKIGRCNMRNAHNAMLYFKPRTSGLNYTIQKLKEFDERPNYIFGCFNSIDQAKDNEKAMILDWISKRIKLTTPPGN